MTFFHFVNCAALAYSPYFIVYKYSGVSEYCSIWRCLRASGIYIITQFIKMLILATCFPDLETDEYNGLLDFFKSIVDGVDAFGIHSAVTYFLTGRGEYRVFAAGFGFAIAHSIAAYGASFIGVARATAFHPMYLQLAVEAGFDLFFYVAFAAIIWLHGRNDFSPRYRSFFLFFTSVGILRTFIFNTLYHSFMIQSWVLVLAKFVFTIMYSGAATYAYSLFRSHIALGHIKQN